MRVLRLIRLPALVGAAFVAPAILFACSRTPTKPDLLRVAATTQARVSRGVPGEAGEIFVILNASIAGRNATVELDNGSPVTTLDLSFAKSLGLPLTAVGRIATLHNTSAQLFQTKPVVVSLRGFTWTIKSPDVVDISNNPSMSLPRRIDAIIGADLFARSTVKIDYGRHDVKIWPGSASVALCWSAKTDKVRLGFITLNGTPRATVAVTVNGHAGTFFLDTGSVKSAAINRRGYQEMHLASEFNEFIRVNDDLPPEKQQAIPVAELSIAQYHVPDHFIWFRNEQITMAADGRVGNGSFNGRTVVIDYAASRMCILR